MNVRKRGSLMRIVLLAGGIGLGLFAAGPASAQYACTYGYTYYPGWGCVAAPYDQFDGLFYDRGRGERFHHEGFRDHEGSHGHGGHR